MGVKGLWKILKPCCIPIQFSDLQFMRIGIDLNLWLYQLIKASTDENGEMKPGAYLVGLFNRLTTLMSYCIVPVLVLDGPTPISKRATVQQRQRQKQQAINTHKNLALQLVRNRLKQLGIHNLAVSNQLKQLKQQGAGKMETALRQNNELPQEDMQSLVEDAYYSPPGSTSNSTTLPSSKLSKKTPKQLAKKPRKTAKARQPPARHQDPLDDFLKPTMRTSYTTSSEENDSEVTAQDLEREIDTSVLTLSDIDISTSTPQPTSAPPKLSKKRPALQFNTDRDVTINSTIPQSRALAGQRAVEREQQTIRNRLLAKLLQSNTTGSDTGDIRNEVGVESVEHRQDQNQAVTTRIPQTVNKPGIVDELGKKEAGKKVSKASAKIKRKGRRFLSTDESDLENWFDDGGNEGSVQEDINTDKNTISADQLTRPLDQTPSNPASKSKFSSKFANSDNSDESDNTSVPTVDQTKSTTTITTTSTTSVSAEPTRRGASTSHRDFFTDQDDAIHAIVKKASRDLLTAQELALLPLSTQYDVLGLQRDLIKEQNQREVLNNNFNEAVKATAYFSENRLGNFIRAAELRQQVDIIRKQRLEEQLAQRQKLIAEGETGEASAENTTHAQRNAQRQQLIASNQLQHGNNTNKFRIFGVQDTNTSTSSTRGSNTAGNNKNTNTGNVQSDNFKKQRTGFPNSSTNTNPYVSLQNNRHVQDNVGTSAYLNNLVSEKKGNRGKNSSIQSNELSDMISSIYKRNNEAVGILDDGDDNDDGLGGTGSFRLHNVYIDPAIPIPFQSDFSHSDQLNYDLKLHEINIDNRLAMLRGQRNGNDKDSTRITQNHDGSLKIEDLPDNTIKIDTVMDGTRNELLGGDGDRKVGQRGDSGDSINQPVLVDRMVAENYVPYPLTASESAATILPRQLVGSDSSLNEFTSPSFQSLLSDLRDDMKEFNEEFGSLFENNHDDYDGYEDADEDEDADQIDDENRDTSDLNLSISPNHSIQSSSISSSQLLNQPANPAPNKPMQSQVKEEVIDATSTNTLAQVQPGHSSSYLSQSLQYSPAPNSFQYAPQSIPYAPKSTQQPPTTAQAHRNNTMLLPDTLISAPTSDFFGILTHTTQSSTYTNNMNMDHLSLTNSNTPLPSTATSNRFSQSPFNHPNATTSSPSNSNFIDTRPMERYNRFGLLQNPSPATTSTTDPGSTRPLHNADFSDISSYIAYKLAKEKEDKRVQTEQRVEQLKAHNNKLLSGFNLATKQTTTPTTHTPQQTQLHGNAVGLSVNFTTSHSKPISIATETTTTLSNLESQLNPILSSFSSARSLDTVEFPIMDHIDRNDGNDGDVQIYADMSHIGTEKAFSVSHPGFSVFVPDAIHPDATAAYRQQSMQADAEFSHIHTMLSSQKVQALGLSTQIITTSLLLAKLMGIEVLIGDGEADTTLALLYKQKYIHSIMTQDNDLVVRGADVIKNAFKRPKSDSTTTKQDDKPLMEMVYCRQNMLKSTLGLESVHLLLLALILGNDYAPGIHNVGPVQALELVSKNPELSTLSKYVDSVRNEPTKHPRWVIPEDFPSGEAIKSFTYPQERLLYAHPPTMELDIENLCDLLWREAAYDAHQVKSTVSRTIMTSNKFRGISNISEEDANAWVQQSSDSLGQSSSDDANQTRNAAMMSHKRAMLESHKSFQTKLNLIPSLNSLFESVRMRRAVMRLRGDGDEIEEDKKSKKATQTKKSTKTKTSKKSVKNQLSDRIGSTTAQDSESDSSSDEHSDDKDDQDDDDDDDDLFDSDSDDDGCLLLPTTTLK